MIQKGQNLRLFIGGKVIACATSCTLHIAADLEDVSSKDSTGDWKEQEVTGKNWDGSADALMFVGTDNDAKTIDDIVSLIGTKVVIEYKTTKGTQNRVVDSDKFAQHGEAIINDLSINSGNRANITYSLSFSGCGALTGGPASSSTTVATQSEG